MELSYVVDAAIPSRYLSLTGTNAAKMVFVVNAENVQLRKLLYLRLDSMIHSYKLYYPEIYNPD